MDEKIKAASNESGVRGYLKRYLENYITVDKSRKGELASQAVSHLRYIAAGVAVGACAYFFASAKGAMGSYPFGIALLTASVKYIPFCYLGAVSAAVFTSGYSVQLFTVLTALLLIRIFVSRVMMDAGKLDEMFCEPLIVRLASGVSCAAALGIWNAARFGFLYYDIFGLVFTVTAVPICATLFAVFFERESKPDIAATAGAGTLAAVAVWSLDGYAVMGIPISYVVAFGLTLYVATKNGALYGSMTGLICGLAADAVNSPAFALAGLAAGLIRNISAAAASAAASVVGIGCGFYMEGFAGLRTLAPGMLVTSLIFTPLAHFDLLRFLPPLPINRYSSKNAPEESADEALIVQKRQDNTLKRLEAVSEAMGALSEVFYSLSERMRRPGIYETKHITSAVYDRFCAGCERNGICWQKEYTQTDDMFKLLSKQLCRGGAITENTAPQAMRNKCIRLEKILKDLNSQNAKLIEEALKTDKLSVFAMDYEAMSRLLAEAASESSYEYQKDEALSNRLRAAAGYMGFRANNIVVYGKRKKTVIAGGVDIARLELSSDELRESFGNVCSQRMSPPQFSLDGEYVTMTMTAENRFTVSEAHASSSAANESMSGDCAVSFGGRGGYSYTLISDGMGSGRDAALSSRMCGIFLKKMLESGNSVSVTFEMLSNFLRGNTAECFTTVDLMCIDLILGSAEFIKSGAAPSFVLRGGSVFRIGAKTLPIGITSEINAEKIRFDLEDGDIIVMISDGIAQDTEDGIWLVDMLSREWEGGLQTMATRILEEAQERNGRRDDATVALVKVVSK